MVQKVLIYWVHTTTCLKCSVATAADLQSNPSGWLQLPVNLDLGYSIILPWHWVATVAAHQLPELTEQCPEDVVIHRMGHPVLILCKKKQEVEFTKL